MFKKFTVILFLLSLYVIGQESEYKIFNYPNGGISSEGLMINNSPDGIWKSYHPNGMLKSVGKWTNNNLDSIWSFYTERGNLAEKMSYFNGKKNGYAITYFIKAKDPANIGRKKSEILYVNDIKNGFAIEYFENGEVKKYYNYVNNKVYGKSFEFDSKGQLERIIEYKNNIITDRFNVNKLVEGKREGLWVTLYDDYSVKEEISYENDLKNGYYKLFNRKGEIVKLLLYKNNNIVNDINEEEIRDFRKYKNETGEIVEGTFIGSNPVGVHQVYKDSSLQKSYLFNLNGVLIGEGKILGSGKRVGNWIDYYESGKIYAKGNYKENRKNGIWTYYFENGSVKQFGNYYNGKPDGQWIWFFNNGDTLKYEEYFNGKENGIVREYNRNGKLIVNGQYIDGERDDYWEYWVGDNIAKGKYVLGLKDGKWRHYYEDGSLKFEGNYIQGSADGKHRYYFKNGVLKEEQVYISGYKEGNWSKYNELGELLITVTYKDDQEVRINGKKIDLGEKKKILN